MSKSSHALVECLRGRENKPGPILPIKHICNKAIPNDKFNLNTPHLYRHLHTC